jgi:membrane protein required for colicin V production
MRILGSAVAGSTMLRYFSTSLLPMVYSILGPVLPDGARLIFEVQ